MATLKVFDPNGIEKTSRGDILGLEIKLKGKSHRCIITSEELLEVIKKHSTYIEKTLSLSDDTEVVDTQKSKYKSLRNGV